jgi:hypothetical protein
VTETAKKDMVGNCITRAPRVLRGQKGQGLTKRLRAALPTLTGAVIAVGHFRCPRCRPGPKILGPISIRGSQLLWGEQGMAFGDLTFANQPLLGTTATAIILDCESLDAERHKVDQRKLTVEEPLHECTIIRVRVRIGRISQEARTMTCSVVDFTWTSLGQPYRT